MKLEINEGVYKQLVKVGEQQELYDINKVLDYLLFVESEL